MRKGISARQLVLDCLIQLEKDNTPIAPVINLAVRRNNLSPADRGLLNELVYGTIRWRGQLDWVLGHFVDCRFRLNRHTRNLLRLGAYQLLHLDKIPPHAAIYETVELAKPKHKTARFINAVLRSVQQAGANLQYPSLESDPARHIAVALSYPLWLVERWIVQHGAPWTLGFCRASNRVAPLTVRVNTLKTSRADLIRSLTADGVSIQDSRIAPDGLSLQDSPPVPSLAAYRDGGFYVQDESAMLVGYLLRPQAGEKVVDLCAAPGGKTTHIAQLMRNVGEIIALDRSQGKLQRITENCQRLGVTNVQTRIANAAGDALNFIEAADHVLIDAPCSGLGTLRRHPDIRWQKKPEQINALAQLQSRILHNAAQYVRPGTVLVYSTCSTEPEENERIIRRFLESHPHFVVEDARDFLPFVPTNAITPAGFLQTFPHEYGIDGTFAARLREV
jgi:16S rRNA (cytosine967-C5)-methyltransferase